MGCVLSVYIGLLCSLIKRCGRLIVGFGWIDLLLKTRKKVVGCHKSLGKINRENNDAAHLIPCVSVTSSGTAVKRIVGRLIKIIIIGLRDEPTISEETGAIL